MWLGCRAAWALVPAATCQTSACLSRVTISFFFCVCAQIGVEKHRMLDLFIQVPAIIRKRLSRRCKEVYETVRAHVSSEELDEGAQEQVSKL